MKQDDGVKAVTIRIPESLWAWLKHRAVDNRRSLNSEILTVLENSKKNGLGNEKTA